MVNSPKYISKKLLNEVNEKQKRAIFNDVIELVKLNIPWQVIETKISKEYGKYFLNIDTAKKYFMTIINEYQPNCIICGNESYRFDSHCRDFTLLCKDCLSEQRNKDIEIQQEFEIRLLRSIYDEDYDCELNAVNVIFTHGDLIDKIHGIHHKLGTSDIGAHKLDNYEDEARVIIREFLKLGLKRK